MRRERRGADQAAGGRSRGHPGPAACQCDRPGHLAGDGRGLRRLPGQSRDLRVAVLRTGGARFFSAGWDLKAAAGGETPWTATTGSVASAASRSCRGSTSRSSPRVEGMAVGGGFELVLISADLIYAAEHRVASRCRRSTRGPSPTRRRCKLPTPDAATTSPWSCCSPGAGWSAAEARPLGPGQRGACPPIGCSRTGCCEMAARLAERTAAGVRGDQGGAAGERAPVLRRGHAADRDRRLSGGRDPVRVGGPAGRGHGVRREAAARVERALRCRERTGTGTAALADHHRGEYTERQRADLDMRAGVQPPARLRRSTTTSTSPIPIAALDPDPLRYMWVDEGDGQIPAQLAKAAAVLEHAPHLAGQMRKPARPVPRSRNAVPPHHRRPRCDHDADRLAGVAGGPRRPAGGRGRTRRCARSSSPEPRGPVPTDGGRHRRRCPVAGLRPVRRRRRSGVWASRFVRRPVERPGTGQRHRRPLVQPGGRRLRGRRPAGVLAGRGQVAGSPSSPGGGTARGWEATARVSPEESSGETSGNVWDPSARRSCSTGASRYAWTEYRRRQLRRRGAARIDARRRSRGPVRRPDRRQRLRAAPQPGGDHRTAGCGALSTWSRCTATAAAGPPGCGPRPGGAGVGPVGLDGPEGVRRAGQAACRRSCCPRSTRSIRVVRVDRVTRLVGAARRARARASTWCPPRCPRLQATADGGPGRRRTAIHRQLPLMTYYWEAAAQVLGPGRAGGRR